MLLLPLSSEGVTELVIRPVGYVPAADHLGRTVREVMPDIEPF